MKFARKVICTLLTVVLLNASMATPVLAAEASEIPELQATVVSFTTTPNSVNQQQRSTTFIDTSIDMAFSAEGMHITIFTEMTMTGSLVGVKDISIKKKGILGIWTTVATSSGAELTNASGIVVALNYAGAEKGETYKVICTHYGNVDGYRELYHESEEITCWYAE